MPRYTLSDAKAYKRIAVVANVGPTDPRFLGYVNTAQEMLLHRGEWWGTFQSVLLCTNESCLVWPRQVASVISISVCNTPVTIRNQFYEYLECGPGIQTSGHCNTDSDSDSVCNQPNWCRCSCPAGMQLIDRGTTCTFADILGENKKIRVYGDVTNDNGEEILLLGYDENGQWIRHQDADNNWLDGELVEINTTPQTSANIFTSLTGVQKPITQGNVRLYEFNIDDSTQRALAVYEPSETNPSYRKSLVSNMQGQACCNGCDDDDERTGRINAVVKLEFIPALVDTDYLLISNLQAIEFMVQSICKSERNLFEESAQWEAKAINELNKQLRHYNGVSVVRPMRFPGRRVYGAGIINMIG